VGMHTRPIQYIIICRVCSGGIYRLSRQQTISSAPYVRAASIELVVVVVAAAADRNPNLDRPWYQPLHDILLCRLTCLFHSLVIL
jgi:hypothetical protein